MKILCSSDIHSNSIAFQRFASELKKTGYDCGILAGDLIDEYPTSSEAIKWGIANSNDFNKVYNNDLTLDDLEEQIHKVKKMFKDENSVLMKTLGEKRDSIIKMLINANKPVFVVLGNHDKINWINQKLIYNIHKTYIDYQGFRFIGYRYTLMEKQEKEIEKDLNELLPHVTENTILVTHSPPFGICDNTNSGDNIGSKALKDFAIECKPKIHIFGHVHEDYGKKDNMVNVSYFVKKNFVSVNIK